MKPTTALPAALAAALALLLPGRASAQEPPPDHPDHQELRAMLRTAKDAVNQRQMAPLVALLDRDFSITMLDQTLVTEPAQLEEYFRRYFDAPGAVLKSVHIDPQAEVLTRFLGGDVGVNRGTSTDTYTLRSGQQLVLHTRWTATLRRADDGRWKIATLHVGANVLDNPILGYASRTRHLWGAGGLVLGLALGVLFGRWRRRVPAAA
jgi:ketosteroid isomerase-like protein